MDHLHNLDSVHQLQAVQRALIALQHEVRFGQDQINELEKYFHYLYSIGYYEGTRLTSHRKRVFEVDESGKILHTYRSCYEAASDLGIESKSVSKAILRKKKCKGKILIYENP